MIVPIAPLSFSFSADGISTAAVFNLETYPIALRLNGSVPSAFIGIAITATGSVIVPGFTVSGVNELLTVTFSTPPPQFDSTNALVVYTLTGTLLF